MTRARRRALLAAVAIAAMLLVAAAAWRLQEARSLPARPPDERPRLLLLTSLPLMFGEAFTLDQPGSPALTALQSRYQVRPISVASPAELAKGSLLMMAQPRAQPAENLVALDQWVRGGGRLLLLADPMLEWPSEKAPGDATRPPIMFADTGLLAHWGLRLDAPDARGPRVAEVDGYQVLTLSPGALFGGCRISGDRLVAHCRVGNGEATIIADADLLDVAALGPRAGDNLDWVLSEVSALER